MRIITGRLGGRLIADIPAKGVRPAMGKTREALFSMLEARGIQWAETAVLDLYAGGGSLAFEAISRGAPLAWLVENGNRAFQCLVKNVADLEVERECVLINADARRFLRGDPPREFNLVFIDPPYGKSLVRQTFVPLMAKPWLAPDAFIAAEIEKSAVFETPGSLDEEAGRFFGQTCMKIWKKRCE